MDFEEMLATVRHNLVTNCQHTARRSRRFEVYLVDPTTFGSGLLMPADEFRLMFEQSIRGTFDLFDTCRVFLPSTFQEFLKGRVSREELQKSTGWWAEWEAAGVSLERWMRDYLEVSGDATLIRLDGGARGDPLFWWWLMCGGLMIWMVLSRTDGVLDPSEIFAGTFDPGVVGGEGQDAWAAPLAYAKRMTSRSDRVCLLIHPNGLDASVVGSAPRVAELFEKAVHRCTLTRRLWALT